MINKIKYPLRVNQKVLLAVLLILLLPCCIFEPEQITIFETLSATDIGYTSCTLNGIFYDMAAEGVGSHGFCLSDVPDPTIQDRSVDLGSRETTGNFSGSFTGLSSHTLYYARTFSTSGTGITEYGNQIEFNTLGQVTDYDGNVYQTVQIGEQVWMAENLKTTHYADGTEIPVVEDDNDWFNLFLNRAMCYYDNSISNKDIYGALYTWEAATRGYSTAGNPSLVQGACPYGWHIPSDAEWTELTDISSAFQSLHRSPRQPITKVDY